MSYDVETVRSHFPSLRSGVAHFDGPGGSQTPAPVAEAVAATMTSSISNRGRVTAAERRADDIVTGARAAMADRALQSASQRRQQFRSSNQVFPMRTGF
jgi:selenocysteine lyase/cysteine desulfurase